MAIIRYRIMTLVALQITLKLLGEKEAGSPEKWVGRTPTRASSGAHALVIVRERHVTPAMAAGGQIPATLTYIEQYLDTPIDRERRADPARAWARSLLTYSVTAHVV
jgi:hypothetical protein